jgi:small-conductance mechanosensitive channel
MTLQSAAWEWLESGAWVAPTSRFVMAVAIVAVGVLAARLVAHSLRRVRQRTTAGRAFVYIVEKVAGYGLVLAGLFIGLSTLGVNLTSLAVFAGAVGVGVGLGLQGVVREFVSGLVSIFDPLVQVGDFVELENGVRGEIAEVGPRATRLLTNDGLNVIIPNSKLIENQVINWTLRGGSRRIHVRFSVAYGADKAKVRDVVLKAAHEVPFTMADDSVRKTQVWMTGFGESALEFELVVWPTFEAVRRPAAMQAAYTWAIEDALRQAGIEMPFPQMDLRLRSLFGREGDAAVAALGFDREPTSEPEAASEPTRNDAAENLVADVARAEQAKAEAEARRA